MTINEKILKKGQDDWVYLAEVASIVRQEMLDPDELAVVERTLRVVQELVVAKLVVIGDLSGEGGRFSPWKLSTSNMLSRIRDEWAMLNKPINIGDVCWLANTPEGDKLAETLPDI